MQLNDCTQCGSPAVEQTRGEMGPGDYKEIQKPNHKGHFVHDPDYYKDVHLDDYNRNDVRISCTTCDNATGWIQPDGNVNGVPVPGIGRDLSARNWNAANPPKA